MSITILELYIKNCKKNNILVSWEGLKEFKDNLK